MMDTVPRRLAAILAADIAGYTRLVGMDEEATITALRSHRAQLLDGLVERHGGRVANTAGDSIVIEFPSAVEAIRCAIAVQRGMAARNDGVAPERRIQFRIGINVGDVVAQGDDLLGDGVNIAARLEGLSAPGGIVLSANAFEYADGKIDAQFNDGGEHAVKNITRPLRIWRWAGDGENVATAPVKNEELPRHPVKPSIAVLPFNNMSGDPEQEYFADGMTEDIITDLSKASGLLVIARNSSFAYKGRSPDVRQVCRELGVAFVLEGSVRRAGGRIRVNAQLIAGSDGGHIWAERYDHDLEDIFVVQDELTREIVAALRVKLTPMEEKRRENRRKVNPEAYDYFYRGRSLLLRFSPQTMIESRRMLERAIEIDPHMASAYAVLALLSNAEYLNRWNNANDDTLAEALALAERACEIDKNDSFGYAALCMCHIWHRQLDAAETAGERCLELDSNSAVGCSALGQVLDFRGRHERALELFRRSFKMDPHYDMALILLGRAQFALGRDEEAESSFRQRIIRNPNTDTTRAYLAALYGATGRIDEARRVWQELLAVNPDFDPERMRVTLPYEVPTWFDRFYGGLEKAGLPG